jgi:hypothetical protein
LFFAVPEPTPLPIPTPAEPHARDRDACAVCHSPLGPDARYCLTCGARRAGARLEFLDVLDERPGHPPAAAPVAAPTPPPSRLDVLRTWPFGLTAVVLLALLIGLVAGRWLSDRDDDGNAAATQVIRVEGAGAGAAVAPAASASTATPAATRAGATSAAPANTTKKAANPVTAPKKITRESEQKALDDTSGDENLAPQDDDPDGANFDEVK